jgi:hypothetical protein
MAGLAISTRENSRVQLYSGGSMNLSNIRRCRWQGAILSLLLTAILLLTGSQKIGAQTTGTLSGTIQDANGAVIPGAQVKLTNEATQVVHSVKTNNAGVYAFPSLEPGTYSLEASAKGFSPKKITGIDLHSGDQRSVPSFTLDVGSESQTVTVEADQDLIPVVNGERSAVLDSQQLNALALTGRDTTELLKVLPGAVSSSSGLNNGPSFSDLSISVQQSSIGNGVNINGAVNRGGTALLSDGASIIDPGDMAASLSIVDPNFTQEVTVQASNFSADIANGPVVVAAISKSGSEHMHAEAYFDARNNVLNANDWQDNHNKNPQGPASYYYPGGDIGGPVPFTHKKVFYWGGLEFWRQNLGNSNVLHSFIPSPEMMAGNFSSDNADNQALCPNGFSADLKGTWCNDITSSMILPDGSTPTKVTGATGGVIPKGFLDPGGAALAKIWPTANIAPSSNAQGYNYYAPVPGLNNGWVYRLRVDYNLDDNTKLYITFQKAHNSELASGTGAHIYWTPGAAIPYPGGGVHQVFDGKVLAGHLVHTFNSTTTNDLMAAWSYGSFPFTEPDPTAALRSTLGYPTSYGSVFGAAVNIPAYSGGTNTFPDFSQNSIFDDPQGTYAVRKEVPQFSDTFTKVWGSHTVKLGGYSQNTDNYQSNMGTYQDGNANGFSGQNPNVLTGVTMGSLQNPTANLVAGITSSYGENNASPLLDLAQQTTSAFVDDTWKVNHHMTVDIGARIEHVGHWYDRQGTGVAVFIPTLVQTDYVSGLYAPGYRWHGVDPGIPLSGQPTRLAFVSPRFGLSYDAFGNGNTVIRGGWGAYRFVTQVNDVSGALSTAQHTLGYSLPGGKSVMLSQIGSLKAPSTICTGGLGENFTSSNCTNGGQTGFDPNDYSQPKTYAYNFTIDQKLKWHTQLDLAYVGSQTTELLDVSEGIEGSNFSALADQNKTPLGALFLADPVTGVISTNPELPGTNLDGTATGNSYAHYHPYGYAYGTNTALMLQGTSYSNYNGLQAVLTRNSGNLSYNINGTWGKGLGTGLQENPFNVNKNYGPTAQDRTFVFNSSYTYNVGKLHTHSKILNNAAGGWSISGISTWQAGGYIPALLGNGVPNFGLSENYINVPDSAKANGVTTNIGDPTYYGTDASVPIMPVLTCDPRKGVSGNQRLNLSCFSAPKVGSQGGQAYPYMRMGAYFDNDLAVFKSFNIYNEHKVEFRISAFNWLNHPLAQFSSANQVNLYYNVDYSSKSISLNQCAESGCSGATQPASNYGVMDTKTAAPYARIITLNAKYSF